MKQSISLNTSIMAITNEGNIGRTRSTNIIHDLFEEDLMENIHDPAYSHHSFEEIHTITLNELREEVLDAGGTILIMNEEGAYDEL